MDQRTIETSVKVPLPALRLRAGIELMISDSKSNILPHRAKYVAVFAGRSVLISIDENDISRLALKEGETYQFQGFTGIYDFTFSAKVLKVDPAQFNARLACPDAVSLVIVRSNLRIKCAVSGSVTKDNQSTAIVINDLSAGGAGFISSASNGAIGDRVQLAFSFDFDGEAVELNLASEIRYINDSEQGKKFGAEFISPSQTDKLMLHYFVNTMYEAGAAV